MNCFYIELFWNYQLTRALISAQKTSTQQNRPESPTVTLNWHASKNEEHKLHHRYMLRSLMKGCSCTTKVQAAAFSCPYLTENKAPRGCLYCQWHYKNLSSLLLPSGSVIFLLIKLLLNCYLFFKPTFLVIQEKILWRPLKIKWLGLAGASKLLLQKRNLS